MLSIVSSMLVSTALGCAVALWDHVTIQHLVVGAEGIIVREV